MQDREIEIRGRDQHDLYEHWQEDKKRAYRNGHSMDTLVDLQLYAPDELAHAQRVAKECKEQKRSQKQPPTISKRNWWAK